MYVALDNYLKIRRIQNLSCPPGTHVTTDCVICLENRGCGVWVLSTSRPILFGNHISECCDHGVAFVSTADDLRENQKLSAQFLQQDQDQVQ